MDMEVSVPGEGDMEKLGAALGGLLQPGDLVYLTGVLGAGKTTMTRGLARGLGYNGRVTSPTFTLMNVYQGRCPVYHFDFYRLGEAELDDLGLDDYLGREGVSIIEWPEAGCRVLPTGALNIQIELSEGDYEQPRRLLISSGDPRSLTILERLSEIVDSGD